MEYIVKRTVKMFKFFAVFGSDFAMAQKFKMFQNIQILLAILGRFKLQQPLFFTWAVFLRFRKLFGNEQTLSDILYMYTPVCLKNEYNPRPKHKILSNLSHAYILIAAVLHRYDK